MPCDRAAEVAGQCGRPVNRLQMPSVSGKIDTTPNRLVYVVFSSRHPQGAGGFHGCEMEVTVDPRSQRILGFRC